MNERPLASVCIPVFNKRDYLARTLAAILGQTYSPLEVVVSDNGSTDGSGDLAREIAAKDSRVRYFRLENTININESWRYALRLGKGEFVKLHSGDDTTLAADFLERMIEPMLLRPELEFTACAVQPILEYAQTASTNERIAQSFKAIAQVCRDVIALPERAQRARKLMERSSFNNLIGTPYAMVFRRACLPESHWSKGRSPLSWPESYPDWDTAVRILLNHRGCFVEGVNVRQHFDAANAVFRAATDNVYDLFDIVAQTMLPFTVLVDPEMSALREQARPEELDSLVQALQSRIPMLVDLSDQVAAFDSPHFANKTLPALHQCVEAYRRDPTYWFAHRRLRQLRTALVKHWLRTPAELVREEYGGPVGQAHCMILGSGIRGTVPELNEQELLAKAHAELLKDPESPVACGYWLALVLLANLRSWPNLSLAMVPDWLQKDFDRYGWTD